MQIANSVFLRALENVTICIYYIEFKCKDITLMVLVYDLGLYEVHIGLFLHCIKVHFDQQDVE